MGKKIFLSLAIIFLILGGVLTLTDSKNTKARYNEIKSYKVVDANELSTYKNNSGQSYVVTNIKINGNTITDSYNYLDGNYYYLKVDAHSYSYDYDNHEDCWYLEDKYSYKSVADNLTTSVSKEHLNINNVFISKDLGTFYENGVNEKKLQTGDLRFTYKGIKENDTLTALVKCTNGSFELQPLYTEKNETYIVGDENDYYKFLEDFLVGDSYLFIFLGVILFFVFFILSRIAAHGSPAKRAKGQLEHIKEEHALEKEAYNNLNSDLKKRYIVFRFYGLLSIIICLAIMIYFRFTTVSIVIGTLFLIAGVTLFVMANPASYNNSTDVCQMLQISKPITIEGFYEAFKNINTPLGSAYLGRFKTTRQTCLIWGPSVNGDFLYFYLNEKGTLGYLGYSFIPDLIKENYNEPVFPPRNDFTENISSLICYHSDIVFLQKEIKDRLEEFIRHGYVNPIESTMPSNVYTFDEDFKLTGQHFTLKDLSGNKVYDIDGTLPLITFTINDNYGAEIFKVKKELLHTLPVYNFFERGEHIGTLEKQFDFVRDRFSMNLNGLKLELVEIAGYFGRNFYVTLNGSPIGGIMDNLQLNLENIIFDNSVIISYDDSHLPLITAMAIMVARELARDDDNIY